MTMTIFRAPLMALVSLTLPALHAQEADNTTLAGLEKAAANFVAAHNSGDAAAVANLFAANGELCGPTGEDLITGRAAIEAHYAERFAESPDAAIALEVDSVRLITDSLAVEDGTAHLTLSNQGSITLSSRYSAVLTKTDSGDWLIASSRLIKDVSDDAAALADLAEVLVGEWSSNKNSVRTDLAIGWDSSGNVLIGDLLTQTPDTDPQPGSLRISWNPAKKSIVSWMFDASGGAIQATWIPTEDGWLIRSEGTTGDGETFSATQELMPVGPNAFVWSATDRIVDGELMPDNEARFVRPAPEPASK
jgi:uncharacterized protein (TIGR02246 family)